MKRYKNAQASLQETHYPQSVSREKSKEHYMLVGSATSIGCNDKRWEMTIAKAQALQRLYFPQESMNKKIWKENSFLISNDLWMKTRPYFFFEWPFIHCGREVISDYKSHLLWRQKGSIFLWPHIMFWWYKKPWHSIDFESITISHLTFSILVSLKIYWKTYYRVTIRFPV